MPTKNTAAPSCRGDCARAASMVAAPIPRKNTAIIPGRLHLSASQAAGIENTPNATNPAVAKGINSEYFNPHSVATPGISTRLSTAKATATVAKIRIKK